MNRVLIFIDDDTFSKNPTGDNPINYYGNGLGGDIVTVSSIAEITEKGDYRLIWDLNSLRNGPLSLSEGDRVLVVGKKAWDILSLVYHNGLRSENGYDASKLDRLGLNCGAFVKVLWRDKDYGMDKVDYKYFLSPEFVSKLNYDSFFKQVIVSTYSDSVKFLSYFDSLDCEFGYDFETNGMYDIPNFKITGCSICTINYGAFFSFTDIERNSTKDEFQDFLYRFRDFTVRHQGKIWVYNLQFEQQVNFRYFGTDVELCDSSVYNIIEGYQDKKYSLKWTAQRVLNMRNKPISGIRSWDDDFDYLNDILYRMYWTEIPNPEDPKKTIKEFKCNIDNFDQTPEFMEVCLRYPDYVDEFKLLIRENFGNTFMNIPSQILGYYCNYDSLNTLLIREQLRNDYTETCVNIYLDNVRLGARLHSGGMYKDLTYHARYQEQCLDMMAYGITYAATAYSKLKLDYYKSIITNIDKYNDSCKILLGRGELIQNKEGKVELIKISKLLVEKYLSELYDSGLDEPTIYEIYGEGVYKSLIDGLKEANIKAGPSMMRKKKPFEIISSKLYYALGLDKVSPDNNIREYMYYSVAYNEFLNVWNTQIKDIYNIPKQFTFLGNVYDRRSYTDKIKKEYFPCTSPKEYDKMLEFLVDKYKIESAFLSMIYNNLNRMEIKKIFDSIYAGMNIDQAYQHFRTNISQYPNELKEIVQMYLSDPYGERMTDTFDDSRGFWKQADYWPEIRKDYDTLTEPYREDDFKDTFKFLRKFCIMSQLFRKYQKVDSTYINGLFKSFDKVVHDTPKLMPDVSWDMNRNDNVVKMFPKFLVCEKDTKRWSSGYHTIISHSDIKKIVTCPKGFLLSYFDISSAEVRSIAYKSKDPVMVNLFETGQDLYVHVGKIAFPDLDWTTKEVKKAKRPIFKQVLLGSLYGMGINTLSANSGVSVQEAQRLHDVMFNEFSVLREYTDKLFKYPLDHDGYINTFYGDKLRTSAWKYRFDPKTGRPDNGALARASRHGCNYCIQNGSAITLAAGFWNNIRVAKQYGIVMQPIIVVHDSNTNYFPAGFMPHLRSFYDENFTEFSRKFTGVPFLYDLFIGSNYDDCCLAKQLSDNKVNISGSNDSILKILNKLDEANVEYCLSKDRRDIIPEYIQNPMERFIRSSVNTCIELDVSEGSVDIEFNLEQFNWGWNS